MEGRYRFRDWRLKRKLLRAKRAHDRQQISDAQYGAIAIDVVERLRLTSTPLRSEHLEGRSYEWTRFPVEAAIVLQEGALDWPPKDPAGSLSRYGPYHKAAVAIAETLAGKPGFESSPHGGFTWTPLVSEFLEGAYFQIAWANPRKVRLEHWIELHKQHFPNLTSATSKVLLAIVSGLIGFFVGIAVK